MFKHKSNPDILPIVDPRPARTTLEAAAADVYPAMRHDRSLDRIEGGATEITLSHLREVRDRTGAIWHLRKLAMEERDAERAAYILKYRPIQTLDGLDPHPRRVEMRIMAEVIRNVAKAMRNG